MHWGKGLALLSVVVVAITFVAAGAMGRSTGIDKTGGLTKEGCTCHGPGGETGKKGVPSDKVVVEFKIDGNPYKYQKGKVYNVSIGVAETDVPLPPSAAQNKGGFNLRVTNGKLAPAAGFERFVKISGSEATHTSDGDKNGRLWNLTWTAPSDDKDAVVFSMFVNTVNGDGAPDEGDHWTGHVAVLMGTSGEVGGGGHVSPEEIGVRWLAHWVGIISFIAVFVVLVLYYFVLKYGETVHATDHRDRKEK